MTRVLVEGSGSLRADLRDLFDEARDFTLLRGDGARDDIAGRVERLAPDVIVVEGHGDEPLGSLLPDADLRSWPPVVLLVSRPDAAWITGALRAGVRAVLPRESSNLAAAIAAVGAGYVVLHPDAAESVVPASNGTLTPLRSAQALTPREIEVLRMMAEGLANKAIAARLHISEHTVKFHVGSIFAKLHAGSRTEAVTLGARQGLVML
jgi:NarL family two-component system response regulator YdfI